MGTGGRHFLILFVTWCCTWATPDAATAVPCSQPIASTTVTVGTAGGTRTVKVSDPNACGWIVDIDESAQNRPQDQAWVERRTFSGRGSTDLTFYALPQTGAARAAVLRAGNHFVTIIQAGRTSSSCPYEFSPAVQVLPSAGGPGTVDVLAPATCGALAEEQSSFLTLTSGASSPGNRTIRFISLAARLARPRAGLIKLNNAFATIIQAAASSTPVCTVTVAPTALGFSDARSTQDVSVNTLKGCPWQASESLPWLSLSPASASGPGTIRATVEANGSAARSSFFTVAGTMVAVSQQGRLVCGKPSASPDVITFRPEGSVAKLNVTAMDNCAWRLAGIPSWLSADSASGEGPFEVTLRAVRNATGRARTAMITLGEQSIAVHQPSVEPGCTWAVQPTALNAPAVGGLVTVRVTTNKTTCGWSSSGVPPGLQLSPNAGVGSATISIVVDANPSTTAELVREFVLAGVTVRVRQPPRDCSYQLTTSHLVFGVEGGAQSFGIVTNLPSCRHVPTTGSSWVVVSGAGAGGGTVQVSVPANDRLNPREADIALAAGVTVKVAQRGQPARATDFTARNEPEPVVWRKSNGTWFHGNTGAVAQFGLASDYPVVGDFDGDGRLDRTVYRAGTWLIQPSSGQCPPLTSYLATHGGYPYCGRAFGLAGDIPLRMDTNGDRLSDFAVYRPGTNVLYVSTTSTVCAPYLLEGGTTGDGLLVCERQWGLISDVPLVADFDGDERTDFAVFRPSNGTWYFLTSTGACPLNGTCEQQWGLSGDIPVAGNFDGVGASEVAVYRPSEGNWYYPSKSAACPVVFQAVGPMHDGLTLCMRQFGLPLDDQPVVQDYDADGMDDLGVVRKSNFWWHVLPSTRTTPTGFAAAFSMSDGYPAFAKQWGLPGDVAISGRH